MYLKKIIEDLIKLKNPEKAKLFARFFKTGRGEYGEGDLFIGLTVPQQRIIAKKYIDTSLEELQPLIKSKYHEHRMVALIIMMIKYKKSDQKLKKEIFDFYLKNTRYINNWDLIDLSSCHIIGNYLLDKKRDVLYNLANSESLWEKRIAIISTLAFIKNNQFEDTLKISEILLHDKHDLIHKAVGWMLREIGKRDQEIEEKFLKKYHKIMPRTMLRYAIEKFDVKKRGFYLGKSKEYS